MRTRVPPKIQEHTLRMTLNDSLIIRLKDTQHCLENKAINFM